jgi:hypothetical protein
MDRAVLDSIPKEICTNTGRSYDDCRGAGPVRGLLASIVDTLLSSQGSGAHRGTRRSSRRRPSGQLA